MKRKLIVDTDTYNEIDDQFAISLVLQNDELFNRLQAITIAPFDNVRCSSVQDGLIKSYQTTMNLIELSGRNSVPVHIGASTFSASEMHDPEFNEAAQKIVTYANNSECGIDIIAIGALTNVYDAICIDSTISKNITVYWLGANNQNNLKMNEFNLRQDVNAVNHILSEIDEFIHFPCIGVIDKLIFDQIDVIKNLGNNKVNNYLIGLFDEIKEQKRIIWDIAPIVFLLDPSLFCTQKCKRFYFNDEFKKIYNNEDGAFIEVLDIKKEEIVNLTYEILNKKMLDEPIIAPSLMCANWQEINKDIKQLEYAGISYFHVDIMDGHYVPNMALGLTELHAIRTITTGTIDVHLMVSNVDSVIDLFINAGVDIIYIHPETTLHINRIINKIKDRGIKVGIALKPSQPLCTIYEYVDSIDYLLIMTVDPGFAGQKFIESVDIKIRKTIKYRDEHDKCFKIALDGAISEDKILTYSRLGVDKFVVGTSFLFKGESYKKIIDKLNHSLV